MHNSWESAQGDSNKGQTLIIEEIAEAEGGYAQGPERALMTALLFDGVVACMNYLCFGAAAASSRYKEGFHWVNTRGNEYIFAFDSVCEALGINPEFLRYGIINAANSRSAEWKRARRNF